MIMKPAPKIIYYCTDTKSSYLTIPLNHHASVLVT